MPLDSKCLDGSSDGKDAIILSKWICLIYFRLTPSLDGC